jgi:DNA-binding CsgD family transcriptional regulator
MTSGRPTASPSRRSRTGTSGAPKPELVGRARELDDVLAARAHTVITGEAGIGKSMLLDAVSTELRDDGWTVLHGRADALEQRIPYSVLEQIGVSATAASFGEVCGALIDFLRARLDESPVALAIDDIDGLDDDTRASLVVACRRLPDLVVLGTSRTEPVVPDLQPAYVRLAPLDEVTTATIAAQVLGAEPDDDFTRALHERTDGNPFFAVEIASSLRDAGLVDTSSSRGARLTGPLRVTRSDAILRRLGPPEPVLDAIAVLGRAEPGDIELIAHVTGIDPSTVATTFDDLVARNILDESYAFTHDLVREAIYAAIGPARQRLLHKAMADAMRATGSADVMALAHHVSVSATAGDDGAARTLVEAGDAARGVAPATAASFYARALELTRQPDPSVMARLSRALSMASRPAEAATHGRAALARLAPGPERARTANVVISALVELGQLAEAIDVADEEVAAAPESAVLAAQRSNVLWHLRRFDEAIADGKRADSLPFDSSTERMMTLGPLGILASYTHVPRSIPELAHEMLSLGATLPPTLELYSAAIASYALASCGFVRSARAPLSRAEVLLEEVGGTAFRANILVARALVDWFEGRWDDAIDTINSSRAELEGAQLAVQAAFLDAVEIEIQSWRGQHDAQRIAGSFAPVPNLADLRTWAIAGAQLNAGRLADARTTLASADLRHRYEVAYRPVMLARAVEVELADGNRPAAEALLAATDDDVQARDNPWAAVSLLRAEALVSAKPFRAAESAEIASSEGLLFEAARSQLVEAELSTTPSSALEEAYRTFQSVGADALRRRAASALKRHGMKVPRQRARSDSLLTDGELKIARLVQQGLRNREIAAALHYSPKTVDVYLSRIYTKLGVSSRLALARAVDSALLADE